MPITTTSSRTSTRLYGTMSVYLSRRASDRSVLYLPMDQSPCLYTPTRLSNRTTCLQNALYSHSSSHYRKLKLPTPRLFERRSCWVTTDSCESQSRANSSSRPRRPTPLYLSPLRRMSWPRRMVGLANTPSTWRSTRPHSHHVISPTYHRPSYIASMAPRHHSLR